MQIPTNPMYDIDTTGVVRLISTGQIIPEYINRHGKKAVKIRGKSHKPSSHLIDRLMLLTYKPLPKNVDAEWISVSFIDGNSLNVSIENLKWDSTWYRPNPLLAIEYGVTAWVTAYGCPEVELRLDNDPDHCGVLVRDSENHRPINWFEHNGYVSIRVRHQQNYIRLHRLIALTFLPHPLDTDHLTVNHKDSNTLNFSLSNLEWATSSQNNFHAYSEGPRSETVRKIRLKNVETGEETVVAGYQEMSRFLKILPQAAHQAMDRRMYEGRPYKGYLIKFDDDTRTWDQLARSGPRKSMQQPEAIAVKNMDTNEVTIYTSMSKLLLAENIRSFMLFRLLNNTVIMPWRRRCFQRVVLNQDLKWPHYPKEILDVYENTHVTDKPIRVVDYQNRHQLYSSVTAWCLEDRVNRCDPAVLSRYLKHNDEKPLKWREWVFSYIDLTKYPVY